MERHYDVRRQWLRKLLRIHAFIFTLSLGVYFLCAFFDPGLLSYDFRQKFRALASDLVVVTAVVLDPPVQPVVSASATCNASTGTLSIALDWTDDVNTYTYDIARNSLPLVSGLASSAYNDVGVSVGTTYQYEVTARGPMGPGFATSLPVSITTPAECLITLATPSVTIVSFGGRNIDSYDGTPRIGNKRPLFSGTTNMPGAILFLAVGESFFTELKANANGYWEWRPPQAMTLGRHTFTITATDPNNTTRKATASFHFDIMRRDDTTAPSKGKKSDTAVSIGISSVFTRPVSSAMDVSFVVENKEAVVVQGETLHVATTFRRVQQKYTHITVPMRYSIIDENQNFIFSETHDVYIEEGVVIRQDMAIPLYMMTGKYFVQGEILFDGLNISKITPFTVVELPLLQLSSGAVITYADVIHHLGWIVFLVLILFLIWLFLILREYGLSLRGDHEISEYDLKRAGYIRK